MPVIHVLITRFIDSSQPGFVECALTDAWGRHWTFREKVPVVSTADLDESSDYPQAGVIGCEIVRRWRDARGRDLLTVDTGRPWGVESTTGQSRFDVLPEQATEQAG
jgi:hypothetical protein